MSPDLGLAPPTAGAVLRQLAREPLALARQWNYKAAVTSSVVRATLFFVVNAPGGIVAALGAFVAEGGLRFVTSGFYGALTQAFRRVEPAHTALAITLVLLPVTGHGLELLVHWTRGTPRLWASIGSSIVLTVISTAFNLFAMRRGVLVVGGDDARPLRADLAKMPGLVADFALAGVRLAGLALHDVRAVVAGARGGR